MAQSRDLEVRLLIKDMDTGEAAQDKLFIRVCQSSATGNHYLPVMSEGSLISVLEELCDTLTNSDTK